MFANFSNVFSKLIVSPSKDAEVSRKHRILNVILVGSIFMTGLLDLSVLYHSIVQGSEYKGISFLLFSTIPVAFMALLTISRKGFFYLSSFLFLGTYFLAITFASYYWGVDMPHTLLAYALLVTVAGIIFSPKFAVWLAFYIFLQMSIIWNLQLREIIPVAHYWKSQPQLSDATTFGLLILLISIVTWLASSEIDKAVSLVEVTESKLQKEKNLLESQINDRSNQIQTLKFKQLAQLHKMAESGKLVSGFFHDLMNSLMAVSLSIECIKFKDDGSKTTALIRQAMTSSRDMSNYIKIIKEYSNTNKIFIKFDVSQEIQKLLQIHQYTIRNYGVKVLTNLQPEIYISTKLNVFYQVMHILLEFSVVHTSRSIPAEPEVCVTALSHNSNIQINMSFPIDPDTLLKLSENNQKTLFKNTSTKYWSLALSQMLIQKYLHGKINFLSRGITLTLPINSNQ